MTARLLRFSARNYPGLNKHVITADTRSVCALFCSGAGDAVGRGLGLLKMVRRGLNMMSCAANLSQKRVKKIPTDARFT